MRTQTNFSLVHSSNTTANKSQNPGPADWATWRSNPFHLVPLSVFLIRFIRGLYRESHVNPRLESHVIGYWLRKFNFHNALITILLGESTIHLPHFLLGCWRDTVSPAKAIGESLKGDRLSVVSHRRLGVQLSGASFVGWGDENAAKITGIRFTNSTDSFKLSHCHSSNTPANISQN
jgi:hypothetical protein